MLRSPLEARVACVDLETTGGMAARHRIIEVGIVLLDAAQSSSRGAVLVNPGVRIPPSIAEFTGIDDAMVASAPTFCGDQRGSAAASRWPAVRRPQRALRLRIPAHRIPAARSALQRARVVHGAVVAAAVRRRSRHNLDALIDRHRSRATRVTARSAMRKCCRRCWVPCAGNVRETFLPRRAPVCCTNRGCRRSCRRARRRPARCAGRLCVSRRALGAVVRRQGQQHPQPCARALRRRASPASPDAAAAQGAATTRTHVWPVGPQSRVVRNGRRARRVAARVRACAAMVAGRESPSAPSAGRLCHRAAGQCGRRGSRRSSR